MNSDLLCVLSSRLDNEILRSLSKTTFWDDIKRFSRDQFWWYLRVCHLFQTELQGRKADWKSVYPLLLRAKKAQDSIYPEERRPFMDVYESSFAVEILLEVGYDPTVNNSEVLEYACRDGYPETAKVLLLDGRVDPTVGGNDPLVTMIEFDELEWAQRLLADPRVDPSDDEDRALRIASALGKVEGVRLLLADDRVDPNTKDYRESKSALIEAVEGRHLEVLQLLLADPRSDPADYDNELIGIAAWEGNYEAVALLLRDERVDPSDDDNSALRSAISQDRDDVIQLLLSDPRVRATWRE